MAAVHPKPLNGEGDPAEWAALDKVAQSTGRFSKREGLRNACLPALSRAAEPIRRSSSWERGEHP